jgi:MscS family membrane protein
MERKGKSGRSQKRGARLATCTGACLLSLVFLFCVPVWPQVGTAASTPTASRPEAPKDPLERDTPRGTVLGFLSAARKGDYELAAQYLNTRLRGKAATGLAEQLFVVLDRRLPARLNALCDLPEGSRLNPLKPNEELAGTISSDDGNVDIIVERENRGKSGFLWMFSSKTLDSIPDLYEEINAVSVDDVLPPFLVNTRLAGIALFEWLAVFVVLPLFYLLTAMLSRALSRLIGPLRRRLYRRPDLPNPQVLPTPIRILLLAVFIRWLLTKLNLPLLERQFWSSITGILTIAGCVWLLILLNGRVEEYIGRRLPGRNLTGVISLVRLGSRAIDVLIIFAGVLVTLHYFGVKPTAALTGLGVGGIAVALAAQKTLENVIGGVSLILDRAVRVGDTLKVGETLGTVNDIGLRSTRIQTPDRTVVSVPNGQIANLSIENFSARDQFWFHPILRLGYETASGQMYDVLASIRTLLGETPLVDPTSVRVRFLGFGISSLEVEVFGYILARDWNQFLEIQEGLLLQIMGCVENSGVQIALPSQTIFIAPTSAATEDRKAGSLKAPASDRKISNQTAARSA